MCSICEMGHKPTKIVQLKGRIYRPIPYSKHRSNRILKKLMKRQQFLNASPFIVVFNYKKMSLLEHSMSLSKGMLPELPEMDHSKGNRIAHNLHLQGMPPVAPNMATMKTFERIKKALEARASGVKKIQFDSLIVDESSYIKGSTK